MKIIYAFALVLVALAVNTKAAPEETDLTGIVKLITENILHIVTNTEWGRKATEEAMKAPQDVTNFMKELVEKAHVSPVVTKEEKQEENEWTKKSKKNNKKKHRNSQ